MDVGYVYRCNECGYVVEIQDGCVGYVCVHNQYVIDDINHGKYGEEWKNRFHSVQNAILDTNYEFYVCPSCGGFKNEPVLSIYQPKETEYFQKLLQEHDVQSDDVDFALFVEPNDDFRCVKRFTHRCPDCNKRMHRYKDGDYIRCPVCKKGAMIYDGMSLYQT